MWILGLVSKQKIGCYKNYSKIIKELFLLSDSRGKEASGFASIQRRIVCLFIKHHFQLLKW